MRSMGLRLSLAMVVLACGVSVPFTGADHAPVLVIPGRPGVPVIISSYDASYTIVEGIGGSRAPATSRRRSSAVADLACTLFSRSLFPVAGARPGYGRYEIEPPPDRRLPPPAPGYYREWGTQSPELPATIDPPADPPPVIMAPTIDLPDRRWHHNMRRTHRFTPHAGRF
jgi:hypothetical protein